MIVDSTLIFSSAQDLTTAAAGGAVVSTNSFDFSQNVDFGPTEGIKVFVECPSLPTSATAGATIAVAVQVSQDDATWETLEAFPAVPIADLTTEQPFLVRAKVAFSTELYRYMQLTYTPSAVLTSGTVTAGIALDVPARTAYPRNYVA
ncbi:hypothetical protein GOB93_14270 [Acetobacter musti]|uniref:Uncharacterized protein n=1 Tax=Acetobacter musti TaxID=864732 RepID=A0ABX0JSN3_9PROT|nr:hypothetical protein [Acetobacter musti]NHN85798.1 hypothetical protein [Acetobacter musti]